MTTKGDLQDWRRSVEVAESSFSSPQTLVSGGPLGARVLSATILTALMIETRLPLPKLTYVLTSACFTHDFNTSHYHRFTNQTTT
jgi:hypothetical protein